MERYATRALKVLIATLFVVVPLFYIPQTVYPYILSKQMVFQALVD